MLDLLERFSRFICKILALISGVALTCMMLLACANMFFRAVWVPVQGTFELMGYFGAIVASFALGLSQIYRSHISVGIFFNMFPPVMRKLLDALTFMISSVFFLLCAREVFNWGRFVLDIGELSETLGIIYYPFVFAVAFGFLCMSFVLFLEMLRVFFESPKLKRA